MKHCDYNKIDIDASLDQTVYNNQTSTSNLKKKILKTFLNRFDGIMQKN